MAFDEILRERKEVAVACDQHERIPPIALKRPQYLNRKPYVDADLFHGGYLATICATNHARNLRMDFEPKSAGTRCRVVKSVRRPIHCRVEPVPNR